MVLTIEIHKLLDAVIDVPVAQVVQIFPVVAQRLVPWSRLFVEPS